MEGVFVSANMDRASFFKTLIDHEVTVELKNDIQIRGTLKSVDQYLNIKLDDIQVVEEIKYPHLVSYSFLSPSSHYYLTTSLLSSCVPSMRLAERVPTFQASHIQYVRIALTEPSRAPSRTSSSAAPSCATSTCPQAPWTCRCWKMPRGEVKNPGPSHHQHVR